MGKISSGCDIVFNITNGDTPIAIRMGSTLSYEQASYEAIAEQLSKNQKVKLRLRDKLKLHSEIVKVTPDSIESSGIVHNGTVQRLASAFNHFDWSNIDQSTKILSTDWFEYYGQDLSNKIILQKNPKTGTNQRIFVVDPSNYKHVSELHQFLLIESMLKNYSDETKQIIENVKIKSIIEQFPDILKEIETQINKLSSIKEKVNSGKDLTKLEAKRYTQLLKLEEKYEHFKNNTPKSPKQLVQDYLNNISLYSGLVFKQGEGKSVSTELENVVKQLQNKNVKEATYNDVFANEIVSNSVYVPSKQLSKIKQSDFIEALQVKVQDLRIKRENLNSGSSEYDANVALTNRINKFIELGNKTPKHWAGIIQTLIEQTDDEFSYSFQGIEKGVIYLKNVPQTLEESYPDFTRKTVEMLKPVETHRGFTIYVDPSGKYYYSRHVLTTKSYGKKYKSAEECKKKIDNIAQYESIGTQSLIEFKTRKDRNVIFTPNKFIPGQVVKSLDLQFKLNQDLNQYEQDLIYDINDSNPINSTSLSNFYKYIVSITKATPENIIKTLQKEIDTFEKAACFIYALNEKHGIDRTKITSEDFDTIINRIKNAKYEYFIIEEVGKGFTQNNLGFKRYIRNSKNKDGVLVKTQKQLYKTVLTPVKPAEIQNNLIKYDDKTARPLSSIRLLRDLSDKISDKLGIKIHVETQSNLEQLFSEWGEEILNDAKGFVRNGEIYINGSVATEKDLFHEYTHIMLGVLKARNFDNYYNLMDIVANTDIGKNIKNLKRKNYPNLSDSDLNEEVFADLFADFIQGRDLGSFLNNQLKDARKAVDESMGSIFGAEAISEEFYHSNTTNIFRQFSHDLGIIMNETNGLEISSGKTFRQASNWIESQIQKYKDTNGKIGIYEECE